MIKDFICRSRYYLLLLLVLMIIFIAVKGFYLDFVMEIDGAIQTFISNYVVRDSLTPFFKIVTNAGGVTFFVIVLVLVLIFIKNKRFFSSMTVNLLVTYMFSVVFKNIFRRERPLINLIDKPSDFSFPSGHTMCSVAFYGFIIYLVLKHVKNKWIKALLCALSVIVFLMIAFSRLYLNVHYFSDVLCGAILGVVCLLMFIDYVKIKEII